MTVPENNYTVNLTNKIQLPNVDYINELAIEKNFSLGRSFLDPPKILSDLYYLFQKENTDPLSFSLKQHLFSSKYIEDNILGREMNDNEKAYYNYTLLFLEKIDFSNVLGITPLDKSLNVIMYLAHLSDQLNKDNKNSDSRNDSEGSKNVDIANEEELAKAIEELSAGVQANPAVGDLPGNESKGGGRGNNREIS